LPPRPPSYSVYHSFSHTTTTRPLHLFLFFFNDPATTEIYTLSLHDALPIYLRVREHPQHRRAESRGDFDPFLDVLHARLAHRLRSEEHTSELQSRRDLVCRLLLEKKKKKKKNKNMTK